MYNPAFLLSVAIIFPKELSSDFSSTMAQFEKTTDNYGENNSGVGLKSVYSTIYNCNFNMSFTEGDENNI